jgi:hypothetical protein
MIIAKGEEHEVTLYASGRMLLSGSNDKERAGDLAKSIYAMVEGSLEPSPARGTERRPPGRSAPCPRRPSSAPFSSIAVVDRQTQAIVPEAELDRAQVRDINRSHGCRGPCG